MRFVKGLGWREVLVVVIDSLASAPLVVLMAVAFVHGWWLLFSLAMVCELYAVWELLAAVAEMVARGRMAGASELLARLAHPAGKGGLDGFEG